MKAVIFDLDGTLIDSAPDIHAAGNRMLAEEGLAPLDFATIKSFIGNGIPTLVDRIEGVRPSARTRADRIASFLRFYEADSSTLTVFYPGVREVLTELGAKGYALGICTNKMERQTRIILHSFGIADIFGHVVGGDTLAVRKPDPAPLHAAVAALGATSVLYVGDSEVDAETAEAAALPFALFTEGYRKSPVEVIPHQARFDTFHALPGIAARLIG